MRCHPGATSLKCVCLCVSGWVGEGLSLCAPFCVGYSVEKSPHSLSLFCWWTTLAKRAEGQTAEITTAHEACDSRPRPFCLDNYNRHRKPWKWTGSRKWPSVGMIRHFKLLLETCVSLGFAAQAKCLERWVEKQTKKTISSALFLKDLAPVMIHASMRFDNKAKGSCQNLKFETLCRFETRISSSYRVKSQPTQCTTFISKSHFGSWSVLRFCIVFNELQ